MVTYTRIDGLWGVSQVVRAVVSTEHRSLSHAGCQKSLEGRLFLGLGKRLPVGFAFVLCVFTVRLFAYVAARSG
jgi:hypothetical protein